MKFFSKKKDSKILTDGLVYNKNGDNSKLTEELLIEQFHFCAYSEFSISEKGRYHINSIEVEHFNSDLKNTSKDGYYNWYAVLGKINKKKKDEYYRNNKFHETLFFQNQEELYSRIKLDIDGFLYYAYDEKDIEAKDFIDFLMLNDYSLVEQRQKHINRLVDIYNAYKDEALFVAFLKKHPQELSYISCIEAYFNLNLSFAYSY
jgi:hypothetical protein